MKGSISAHSESVRLPALRSPLADTGGERLQSKDGKSGVGCKLTESHRLGSLNRSFGPALNVSVGEEATPGLRELPTYFGPRLDNRSSRIAMHTTIRSHAAMPCLRISNTSSRDSPK